VNSMDWANATTRAPLPDRPGPPENHDNGPSQSSANGRASIRPFARGVARAVPLPRPAQLRSRRCADGPPRTYRASLRSAWSSYSA
jgi:hypothetical protein